jgi:hypothetical protein
VLRKPAVKSIDTDPGTVKLSHDKAVFFNKITDRFFLIGDSLKPFVLVHVTLYDVLLSLKDITEVFALIEHGSLIHFARLEKYSII